MIAQSNTVVFPTMDRSACCLAKVRDFPAGKISNPVSTLKPYARSLILFIVTKLTCFFCKTVKEHEYSDPTCETQHIF